VHVTKSDGTAFWKPRPAQIRPEGLCYYNFFAKTFQLRPRDRYTPGGYVDLCSLCDAPTRDLDAEKREAVCAGCAGSAE